MERGDDSWEVTTHADECWAQLLSGFHANLPRSKNLEEPSVYEHSNTSSG